MRPDAYRWIRPDAARFLKPGTDVASVFPALERKYSPSQPRVPAGNPDGGQWTDGGGDGSNPAANATARPVGSINFDLSEIGNLGLFQIAPRDRDNSDYARLAGDMPEGDGLGIGHNQGPPLEPSEIPLQRPESPADRMKVVWDIARWVNRVGRYAPAVDIFFGAKDQIEWLKSYDSAMKSYSDPPKTLEELQSRVSPASEPGYEDHHIEERTLLRRLGFTWGEIDDPSNKVRIPTLKHYEISGWFSTRSDEFGGLTPRDYLRDKDSSERRRVGIEALIDAGVLKP
ncbi:hypothetical protein YH63_020925 [Afipia massiliensis]|uniref:Uncharacterized protein n=1 Tax=Afipia massiliensis TaxID=211460 RepID=A0A4U6BSQ6_9BRAD|nr:hypothetical protein [Afipia massiliensis]TKT73689.1 hypothetical protein YH63_020925 [Afipia massiliensis]